MLIPAYSESDEPHGHWLLFYFTSMVRTMKTKVVVTKSTMVIQQNMKVRERKSRLSCYSRKIKVLLLPW